MKITIFISDPPSVNTARQPSKSGRRLISTAAYRKWLADNQWEVAAKCRKHFGGMIRVEIASPRRRRIDVDNISKATLDLLQKAGVYANDRQVDDLRVYRADIDQTTVTVEAL